MYCFVILLLFNEMQMSVRRFSAIPHLRALVAPEYSTVLPEPAMIRQLTKAVHSLPVSPNIFRIPKWRLRLAPFFLLTLRIAFC